MATLRNILAVIIGLVAGAALNMSIIMLGPLIAPPPPGVDVTDMDSVRASIHLFEFKHFVAPFLAHALGTLFGAVIAFLLAVNHRELIALGIGATFLAGGISAATMIPAPGWFLAADLILAYLPMAWLGKTLGARIRGRGPRTP